MARTQLPPPVNVTYNEHHRGIYGEFGTGANTQIFFIQTGLKPAALSKVTMIDQIPNSETWSVRDLFQRDVDQNRVTDHILPYFKNPNKVKFFNPLTLTLLPYDPTTNTITRNLMALKPNTFSEDSHNWRAYEMAGHYRFRRLEEENAEGHECYGVVDWNSNKCKLVAIDGQHRLFALKRFFLAVSENDRNQEARQWTIPVVIFGLRAVDATANMRRRTILDSIRSIFVYINTTAIPVNDARKILLSDEKINCICAQELLEYAHRNDVEKPGNRIEERIPLLMFDWRGEDGSDFGARCPGSLKSVVEIHAWLQHYLLHDDFSPEQRTALGVQPPDQLQAAFANRQLDPDKAGEVRDVFNKGVLPGIVYFLENFKPYKNYISQIRKLEAEYIQKSDYAEHAFFDLRFGSNRGAQTRMAQAAIQDIRKEIVEKITVLVNRFPPPLDQEIGMRGVMCAFGKLRPLYSSIKSETVSREEYGKWFTQVMNKIWDDDWLNDNKPGKKKFRRHITYDHGDTVVNYRLENAENALGAFVLILTLSRVLRDHPDLQDGEGISDALESAVDDLRSTVNRGYRREVRPAVNEKMPTASRRDINEEVQKQAEKKTAKHIEDFRKKLDI